MQQSHETAPAPFEMVRLSKSKKEVDLAPNTIRAYFQQGLPCYRRGKCVFFSRTELRQFIVAGRAN